MNQIYVSTIYSGSLKSASELFKFCADGDFEKVKSLTNANANIYKPVGGGYNFVPLTVAFNVKNLKLVNFLLDIYERDLEALKGTNFKRALVAFPDDQTEELCKTVEAEPSDDVVPVLFKNSNRASPKCFYLRQKLANKYDQSLRLARKLEVENGCCDLNWRFIHSDPEDSFLHLAIYFGMKTVVGRLLNHPTVESKLLNSNSHSPLHYAIHSGNHLIINLLLSKSDYSRFHDDPSYLYQAAVSGKPNALDFVMDKMLESGKSLHDILRTKFQFEYYEQTTRFDYLFHVIANSGSCQGILESEKYLYDEQDFLLQNSNGDTFLHRLVLNSHLKLNVKIKEISRAAGKFPKLLLVENIDKHLPLHLAAFADVRGHKLFHHLLNLTVKESGNPSIFFANIDSAVSTVEKAIEVNRGLSLSYLQNFEEILQSHGPRLLMKTIKVDKRHKSLQGILSSKVHINPNAFYDGSNGFLSMLQHDIEKFWFNTPGRETYKRLQLLMNYHPIEDVNARDGNGTTLFMQIIGFCEDNDFIESLIKSGADCLAMNVQNVTCLHHAVMNLKNKEIIQLLLDHGADPSVASRSLGMPIHFAIKHGNVVAVESLIPLLSGDDLLKKFGRDDETLIQFCMACSRDDILRIVCEFYASRNVKIVVNDVNGNGDNMPMIALNNSNAEHLDFIFSNFIDEINFDARNKTGETFVHKFALCQQMMRCEALFEKIPILSAIVNKQMNSVNDNGLSPMDNLLVICEYDGGVDDTSINFFTKFISVENLRKNFHKFVKSFLLTQKLMEKFPKILDDMKGDKYYRIMSESTIEPQTFDFILHQLLSKLADVRNSYGKNVLHLVCESNDPAIIDSTIKLLLDDDLKEFANEIDVSDQRAFDLLNDINKSAFGKCFV